MERQKCEECGGSTINKKVDFKIYGISLGEFPAEVCSKCGEEIFDEKVSEDIDLLAKKKGLWGLDRKVKIEKLKNLKLVEKIAKKSKLTEKDVLEFNKKLKIAATKRFLNTNNS